MTKKELIQEITKRTQQYLGFGIDGVAGLQSRKKAELELMLKRMTTAARIRTYANRLIDAQTPAEKLFGSNPRITLLLYYSSELYFKKDHAAAKVRARELTYR